MQDRDVHSSQDGGGRLRDGGRQPPLPLESNGRSRPAGRALDGRSTVTLRRRVLGGEAAELDDAELLSVLLGPERASGTALRLARGLLERGLLARDGRVSPLDAGLRGLGPARRVRLLAALELARRLHPPPAGVGVPGAPLEGPRQVYEWTRSYALRDREHFLVLHLNTRHVPRRLEVISIGSLDASIVHPREVFRSAIREAAAAIILVHNHPSGDPYPSRDDIQTTDRLVQAGKLVGIHVMDHVVIAGERFFSFREEGLMDGPGRMR